ncbi:MAG: glycerate kinase, partial [Cyclobacteriaceae bacterium]|nr:glycerate kinase [Cyclobacteriaceae bacterium]
ERNCLNTSSLGTGELIWDAIDKGARQIYLFIGGSATTEAGLGILQALGINAINKGQILPPVGSSLVDITEFDTSGLKIEPQELEFIVVCDVRNPLYGPQGAAFVYAPQKGADQQAVHLLDKGLRNFADIIRQQRGLNVHDFEGSGAAGGIAAGIKSFFPARIQRGIDTIMELVDLRTALSRADLVITGEGKLDGQTLEGKVIAGVHGLCKIAGKKLAVICGSSTLTPEQTRDMGFWEVQPLVKDDIPMQEALDNAFELVSKRAFELLSARSFNDL